MWYLIALALVWAASVLLTASDVKLHGRMSRGQLAVCSGRWGFFMAVLLYAFLIDSRRAPYEEPAIWAFLGLGALGAALLGVWALRG